MTMKAPEADQTVALSSSIDISRCDSVCLMLGPYRNLTTLTAAVLFLHPHCQVLNHAGMRIFGNPDLDFLADFSRERFDNFVRYAIMISAEGKRGDYGGSITLSHAFEEMHPMRGVFQRSGAGLLKSDIRCLFWKESQRTTNVLRYAGVNLDRILAQEPRLRFVMPIRNPIDCALSNLKTGHVENFPHLTSGSSIVEVVEAVLDEILWFATLQNDYPGRFFSFLTHEMGRQMFSQLAVFLGLEPLESWLDDAVDAARPSGGYEYEAGLEDHYRSLVNERFAVFPSLASGLLAFVDRA